MSPVSTSPFLLGLPEGPENPQGGGHIAEGQVRGGQGMSFHFDNKPSIITQPAPLLLSSSFIQTMLHEYYEKESQNYY